MSDLKKYLLSQISEDELVELIRKLSEDNDQVIPTVTEAKLTDAQKFYLSQSIPNSSKRCHSCGRSLFVDKELDGGESN